MNMDMPMAAQNARYCAWDILKSMFEQNIFGMFN